MGVRLVEGRTLTRADREDRSGAVVVTRPLADEFWPGRSALGRRVRTNREGPWYTVVGVVDAVRSEGLMEPPPREILFPLVGLDDGRRPGTLYYALRASVPPESLVAVVRREVAELDPAVPLAQVEAMAGVLENASAQPRFTMLMLVLAGGVALILGLVGVYGVISYTVSLRGSEIGVRMALGAGARTVAFMVLRQGGSMALLGIGIGLAGAVGLSRVMKAVVFQIAPTDPATYGCTAGLLFTVALAATWIPARRAARLDPAETLRVE